MQPEAASAEPFNPASLRPEASLNRTRIGAMPGANPAWVGIPAHELLSLEALESLAEALGFAGRAAAPSRTSRDEPAAAGVEVGVTWSLAAALSAEADASIVRTDVDADASPQAAIAQTVAETYGRRLAHLLATLVGGHAEVESPSAAGAIAVRATTEIRPNAERLDAARDSAAGSAGAAHVPPGSAAGAHVAAGSAVATDLAPSSSGAVHPAAALGWRRTCLDYWAGIERIWLGGGVAASLTEPVIRHERRTASPRGLPRPIRPRVRPKNVTPNPRTVTR